MFLCTNGSSHALYTKISIAQWLIGNLRAYLLEIEFLLLLLFPIYPVPFSHRGRLWVIDNGTPPAFRMSFFMNNTMWYSIFNQINDVVNRYMIFFLTYRRYLYVNTYKYLR